MNCDVNVKIDSFSPFFRLFGIECIWDGLRSILFFLSRASYGKKIMLKCVFFILFCPIAAVFVDIRAEKQKRRLFRRLFVDQLCRYRDKVLIFKFQLDQSAQLFYCKWQINRKRYILKNFHSSKIYRPYIPVIIVQPNISGKETSKIFLNLLCNIRLIHCVYMNTSHSVCHEVYNLLCCVYYPGLFH